MNTSLSCALNTPGVHTDLGLVQAGLELPLRPPPGHPQPGLLPTLSHLQRHHATFTMGNRTARRSRSGRAFLNQNLPCRPTEAEAEFSPAPGASAAAARSAAACTPHTGSCLWSTAAPSAAAGGRAAWRPATAGKRTAASPHLRERRSF